MKLYELSAEIAAALAGLEGEEIDPDTAGRLDRLGLDLALKAENVCKALRQYQLEADMASEEISRLGDLHGRLCRRAAWLREYLGRCLSEAGLDGLQAGTFKVWWQKNGRPSVTLAPGATIPERYLRVKHEFDSSAALADARDGLPLPPSVVVVQGRHLRIK